MQQNVNDTFSILDRINIRFNDFLYTASIAKEVASSKGGNGGILIIGMIIVIVGLVGYIFSKNK